MRKTVSLLAALAAALLLTAPAGAVQFGSLDGLRHPQVGMIGFFKAGATPWRCTGTLISPTHVLTAAHCTAGADSARVWFDPVIAGTPTGGIPATPYTKAGYDGFASFPASNDLGMVVLSAPQAVPFATLAPAGYLDGLKQGSHTSFDVVGYGVQDALPPTFVVQRARYAGEAIMVNTKSAFTAGYNVQLTAAPGTGGALCDGDSGGPVFLAGTTQIVAVVSLKMTAFCMGGTLAYRTDTPDSLRFVESFASS